MLVILSPPQDEESHRWGRRTAATGEHFAHDEVLRGHHVSGNPWSEGSREGVGRPALKSREIALTTVFSGDGILNP